MMPSIGHILSNTPTSDGMGGYSDTWGTVVSVPCDLWPISRRGNTEPVVGGQVTSQRDWFIDVPVDTAIVAGNRMEISGRTFEVTFVPNGASWQTGKSVEARLLNEERRV